MTTLNNDRMFLESFLSVARQRGCAEFVVTSDGDRLDEGQTDAQLIEAMTACDECRVSCRSSKGTRLGWFWVVLGNGPGETFADFGVNPWAEAIFDSLTAIFDGLNPSDC